MIGLYNFDSRFMDEFRKSISEFHTLNIYDPFKNMPNLDGFFINLLPKDHPNMDVIKGQIALIEKAKQDKKKLFIFDGNLSLTEKEMKWLRNSSIIFEPALHNHDRTVYLPHWLSFTLDYKHHEEDREFDFTCAGDLDTELADTLFFKSAKYLDAKFAVKEELVTSSDIAKKCKENGIEIISGRSFLSHSVILLPSKFHISTGFFPSTQVYIDTNTGIMFPGDMIYYRFMPQVWNKEDINYYYKRRVQGAYVLNYKIEIERFYPRMLLENVIKKIKEYV